MGAAHELGWHLWQSLGEKEGRIPRANSSLEDALTLWTRGRVCASILNGMLRSES